jgi:hypothetical protein
MVDFHLNGFVPNIDLHEKLMAPRCDT